MIGPPLKRGEPQSWCLDDDLKRCGIKKHVKRVPAMQSGELAIVPVWRQKQYAPRPPSDQAKKRYRSYLLIFVHISPLDESSLDARTTVGQFLSTIVLDALAPNSHFSFGMEFGNPGPASVGKVNSYPTILIQQVHLECRVIHGRVERGWESCHYLGGTGGRWWVVGLWWR